MPFNIWVNGVFSACSSGKVIEVHEVAQKLTARADEFARLLTLEGGKPLVENKDEMEWSTACFRYYAEIGRISRGRVIPSIEPSQLALVLKEPYGVVAAIIPWNYPIYSWHGKSHPLWLREIPW